jgi:malonyl-CoA decarboxylase
MAWLQRAPLPLELPGLPAPVAERGARALTLLRAHAAAELAALGQAAAAGKLPEPVQEALLRSAAIYLAYQSPLAGGDPVARFHLDNGARLERLNPRADLSAKGVRQSAGIMVNYLYDLAKVDACHDRFVHGRVVHSRAVAALL